MRRIPSFVNCLGSTLIRPQILTHEDSEQDSEQHSEEDSEQEGSDNRNIYCDNFPCGVGGGMHARCVAGRYAASAGRSGPPQEAQHSSTSRSTV